MLVLPITNGPNLVGSYVIQILTGDSRIPSNFKDKYSAFFASVSFSDAYLCSISNDS